MISTISSALKIKRLKNGHRKDLTAHSTPRQMEDSSEDSFLQLEDSKIDFEDSPSNRSHNKSFSKSMNVIANSTPVNHNQGASIRRSRLEFSTWEDNDMSPYNVSPRVELKSFSDFEKGMPMNRKKLFGDSDDSD